MVKINSSIRNYFLVMPLLLVLGGGLLWGAGSWMAHNYRDLSHHFIEGRYSVAGRVVHLRLPGDQGPWSGDDATGVALESDQ